MKLEKEFSFEDKLRNKFIGSFKNALQEFLIQEVETAVKSFRKELTNRAEEQLIKIGLDIAKFVDVVHQNDRLIITLGINEKEKSDE